MNAPTNEHVIDLIPGYALGCLNAVEISEVGEHLSNCRECQSAYQAYRQVVDDLYLAAPEAAPPPEVKERVMEKLPAAPSGKAPSGAARRPWERRAARARLPAFPSWAFAGLLVTFVLGLGNLWLWQRVRQLEDRAPTNFRMVTLVGTENTPSASGILVMDMDGDHGTLVTSGLPVLGPDRQYQLWVVRDDVRKSAGVFSVSEEGYGALVVEADQPLYLASSFGVTEEPAGGSPGPTGLKVLGGSP